MQRYLIQFSYFGTHFRGLQTQGYRYTDFRTVQGLLEAGLRFLKPTNDPITHCASRTDAGVHALSNYMHVDLIPPQGQQHFDPSFITHHLNVFFRKAEVNIRVQQTLRVSQAFSARHHACRRHYLYRLATITNSQLLSTDTEWGVNFLPLAEVNRLFVVRNPVDVELLREGCALLQREADFATFMRSPGKDEEFPDTVKNMEKVELREGQPLMNPIYDPAYDHLQLWDILFTSRSFLHNQIRRCVCTIVGLADGTITKDDIELMFANPHPSNMANGISTAPASGLYLLKVEYPDHVLDPNFEPDNVTEGDKRASAIKTAVAHGQTSIVEDPSSPVEVLAKKFSEVNLQSRVPNGVDTSMRTVESASVDSDAEYRDLENESSVYSPTLSQNSIVDDKLGNPEDSTFPLSDTVASSFQEKNFSQMALGKVHNENSSSLHTRISENALEKLHARDTDNDFDVTTSTHNSSSTRSKVISGSTRRNLLLEAHELLEGRQNLDMRLKIVLELLINGNKRPSAREYSEEKMERLVVEIKELMLKIQVEKITLACATRIRPRPARASMESPTSG